MFLRNPRFIGFSHLFPRRGYENRRIRQDYACQATSWPPRPAEYAASRTPRGAAKWRKAPRPAALRPPRTRMSAPLPHRPDRLEWALRNPMHRPSRKTNVVSIGFDEWPNACRAAQKASPVVAFWNSAPRQLTVSCRGWESTSSSWLIYVLASGIRRRVTQWRNGGSSSQWTAPQTTTPSTITNVFVGLRRRTCCGR